MARSSRPPTSELPDIPPLELAIECVRLAESTFGHSLREIAGFDYSTLLLSFLPGVERKIPNPQTLYYEVSDQAAHHIAIQAAGDMDVLRMVQHICACNIMCGVPVPASFRALCHALILGVALDAKRPGPKTGTAFGSLLVGYLIARYLKETCGIPLTSSDGGDAAELVCTAFQSRDYTVSYGAVSGWLTHSRHKISRARAEGIRQFMRARIAEESGLLSTRGIWVLGPNAVLQEIWRVKRV